MNKPWHCFRKARICNYAIMHTSFLHPPLPAPFQEDANWKAFAAHIEQYFLAHNITDDDDRKRAILLTSLSFRVFNMLWNFYFPDNLKTKTFEDICEVLKIHFSHSVYDERSKFYDAKQHQNESVTVTNQFCNAFGSSSWEV